MSAKRSPRAMPMETIITRNKSRNQLLISQNKNISKSISPKSKTILKHTRKSKELKSKNIQKRPVKAINNGEFYPDKLKRNTEYKKVVLMPKNHMKMIGGTNKRKRCMPRKEIKRIRKDSNSSTLSEIEPMSPTIKFQDPELTVKDMVLLIEEQGGLNDEDLLEILTCPSPVWWEDPPTGYIEDPIFTGPKPAVQKSIKNQLAEQHKEAEARKLMDEESTCKANDTNNLDESTLSVSIENRGINFMSKRFKLESLLSGIRNKEKSENFKEVDKNVPNNVKNKHSARNEEKDESNSFKEPDKMIIEDINANNNSITRNQLRKDEIIIDDLNASNNDSIIRNAVKEEIVSLKDAEKNITCDSNVDYVKHDKNVDCVSNDTPTTASNENAITEIVTIDLNLIDNEDKSNINQPYPKSFSKCNESDKYGIFEKLSPSNPKKVKKKNMKVRNQINKRITVSTVKEVIIINEDIDDETNENVIVESKPKSEESCTDLEMVIKSDRERKSSESCDEDLLNLEDHELRNLENIEIPIAPTTSINPAKMRKYFHEINKNTCKQIIVSNKLCAEINDVKPDKLLGTKLNVTDSASKLEEDCTNKEVSNNILSSLLFETSGANKNHINIGAIHNGIKQAKTQANNLDEVNNKIPYIQVKRIETLSNVNTNLASGTNFNKIVYDNENNINESTVIDKDILLNENKHVKVAEKFTSASVRLNNRESSVAFEKSDIIIKKVNGIGKNAISIITQFTDNTPSHLVSETNLNKCLSDEDAGNHMSKTENTSDYIKNVTDKDINKLESIIDSFKDAQKTITYDSNVNYVKQDKNVDCVSNDTPSTASNENAISEIVTKDLNLEDNENKSTIYQPYPKSFSKCHENYKNGIIEELSPSNPIKVLNKDIKVRNQINKRIMESTLKEVIIIDEDIDNKANENVIVESKTENKSANIKSVVDKDINKIKSMITENCEPDQNINKARRYSVDSSASDKNMSVEYLDMSLLDEDEPNIELESQNNGFNYESEGCQSQSDIQNKNKEIHINFKSDLDMTDLNMYDEINESCNNDIIKYIRDNQQNEDFTNSQRFNDDILINDRFRSSSPIQENVKLNELSCGKSTNHDKIERGEAMEYVTIYKVITSDSEGDCSLMKVNEVKNCLLDENNKMKRNEIDDSESINYEEEYLTEFDELEIVGNEVNISGCNIGNESNFNNASEANEDISEKTYNSGSLLKINEANTIENKQLGKMNNEKNNEVNESEAANDEPLNKKVLNKFDKHTNNYSKHGNDIRKLNKIADHKKFQENVKKVDCKSCNFKNKSIIISENDTVKYCLQCSSIYDTDSCKYCIKKLKKECTCKNVEYVCDKCSTSVSTKDVIIKHLKYCSMDTTGNPNGQSQMPINN